MSHRWKFNKEIPLGFFILYILITKKIRSNAFNLEISSLTAQNWCHRKYVNNLFYHVDYSKKIVKRIFLSFFTNELSDSANSKVDFHFYYVPKMKSVHIFGYMMIFDNLTNLTKTKPSFSFHRTKQNLTTAIKKINCFIVTWVYNTVHPKKSTINEPT